MKVLFVDDEVNIRDVMSHELVRLGHQVQTASTGEEAMACVEKENFDAVVLDIKMPGMDGMETLQKVKEISPFAEVVMLTGHGTIENAIETMKMGAFDYLTKPCRLTELVSVLGRIAERQKMRKENLAYRQSLKVSMPPEEIVTEHAGMKEILKLAREVGATNSPVLIEGESGTGKELIARSIHRSSPRTNIPLVTINCGALPETLLGSELFGYEKGAFTGATDRKPGLFEVAHHGTFFLDEVGEMSPQLQASLLRVLEYGEFMRVGGTRQIKVDVRILCATNKRLSLEVKENRFRQDLYYRMNVVHIQIPPLRERREDIPLLINHYMTHTRSSGREVPRIPASIVKLLCEYDWPGNVRELVNLIERLVLLCSGREVTVQDIPSPIWDQMGKTVVSSKASSPFQGLSLSEVEKQHILETLMLTQWNKTKAAQMLGISLQTLYNKLKEYRITPP